MPLVPAILALFVLGTLPPDGAAPLPAVYQGKRVNGPMRPLADKLVALTFDDGPAGPRTERILDCLKEHGFHATFFVLGERAVRYPGLLKRMLAEGHAIGNHSYSHPVSTTRDRAERELVRTDAAIAAAVGATPDLFRPPYGIVKGKLAAGAKSMGKAIVLWSVDTSDWRKRTSAAIARTAGRANRGDIVLMHDIHDRTVRALPAALEMLASRGYRSVTVPELLDEVQREKARHPAPVRSAASKGAAARR